MKLIAALILALIVTPALAAPPIKVADLAWMTGAWIQTSPERTVRETWLPAAGDQMIGLGQTHRPGRRPTYEFTRIEERDGVIAFTAVLEGQPPTAFPLLSAKDGEVVFENKAHDFPQRVIYRRCGEGLCRRIEGTVDGKLEGEDWRYTRVKSGD